MLNITKLSINKIALDIDRQQTINGGYYSPLDRYSSLSRPLNSYSSSISRPLDSYSRPLYRPLDSYTSFSWKSSLY